MWGLLFAHIVTATGWTLPVVRRLTLWEVQDLVTYWADRPPAHVGLVALGGVLAGSATLRAVIPGPVEPTHPEVMNPAELASALGLEVRHGAKREE